MTQLLIFATLVLTASVEEKQSVVLVVGAAGTPAYRVQFAMWADRWQQAAGKAGVNFTLIGREDQGNNSDRQRLQAIIKKESEMTSEPLWLVLIGHGTFGAQVAKFNLRGPDVSAVELNQWLLPLKRPVAVINCSSSSGPFIHQISRDGRIVITATKSGYEHNYSRFGDYLSTAITELAADLDKDGQTSLLEAFIAASRRVAEFYEQETRLATEHALLDDNGDKLGTPADWFRGIRATRKAKTGVELDGLRAHQFHLIRSPRERNMSPELRLYRNEIELSIERLRKEKDELEPKVYYDRLEPLLIELAQLYKKTDPSEPKPSPENSSQDSAQEVSE